jgi:hypothetical protein
MSYDIVRDTYWGKNLKLTRGLLNEIDKTLLALNVHMLFVGVLFFSENCLEVSTMNTVCSRRASEAIKRKYVVFSSSKLNSMLL